MRQLSGRQNVPAPESRGVSDSRPSLTLEYSIEPILVLSHDFN